MRIVMITPDIAIDRRIIQEAETLTAQGNEVIIVACHSEGFPEYEMVNQIKIDRVPAASARYSVIEKIILKLSGKSMSIINKISGFNFAVAGFLSSINNKIFYKISALINKIMDFIHKSINKIMGLIHKSFYFIITKIMNVNYRIIVFFAKCLNKFTLLSLKAVAKFRGLNNYENQLLWKLKYYEPDIVHAHDLPYLKIALKAGKKLKVPVIYDAHELYPEISTIPPKWRKKLWQLENKLIKKCDQVITVNPYIAKEMAKRYNIAEPNVITNAVSSPADFKPLARGNLFREKLNLPEDAKILLFQGWMSPDRGLQVLIRSIPLTDKRIHLIMMGYGDYIPNFKSMAQELGVSDRIHFLEAVPQDELLYWDSSADAGIIPYPPVDLNGFYCSPNKLFEFIRSELPIIANDLPFLRDVVGGGGFGVVSALNTEEDFARAIGEMFDESLGGPARFKENLRGHCLKYDWKSQETILIDIYRRTVSDNHKK